MSILWKDNPKDWPAEYCLPYGSFNVKNYQEKIDNIAGKSRGRSILRLVWGASQEIAIFRYSEWDSFGRAISEVREPKYKIRRDGALAGMILHVPVRRWIIEQLQEPEQYRIDEEEDTKFENEHGVTCKVAEKPTEMYTPLIYVGDHSVCEPNCCAKRLCLGDFKEPDQAELNWITRSTFQLSQEFNSKDPYRPFNDFDVARAAREAEDKKVRISEEAMDEILESIM